MKNDEVFLEQSHPTTIQLPLGLGSGCFGHRKCGTVDSERQEHPPGKLESMGSHWYFAPIEKLESWNISEKILKCSMVLDYLPTFTI